MKAEKVVDLIWLLNEVIDDAQKAGNEEISLWASQLIKFIGVKKLEEMSLDKVKPL